VVIPAERMFHVPGMGTTGLVGLSPIDYHRESIGLGLAAEKFGANFFGRGSHLDVVLSHPKTLSDDAMKRIRQKWAERYQGINKSFEPGIVQEGMTVTPISIPPEQAQFLETRQFQVTDIARIFRVPPHKIQDLGRATWGNIEHMGLEFVTDCLQPWLIRWEQTITWKLLTPAERKTIFAEFLVDALLRGDTASRFDAYVKAITNGIMNRNEARAKENLAPYDGGDVYLVPLNMVPSDQAGNVVKKDPANTARNYEPLIADASERITGRLIADFRRESKKQNFDLDSWIASYNTDIRTHIERVVMPLLETVGGCYARQDDIATD